MREKYKHTILSSKVVYDSKFFQIIEDEIKLPSGVVTSFIRRTVPPYSIIVPELGDKLVMARQYRHGIQKESIEFPMGRVEGKGHEEAAHIELKEETGYKAENMVKIGEAVVSPGFSDLKGHVYLATGLKRGEQELEDYEFIDVVELTHKELRSHIDSGKIYDAATIFAYYYYNSYRKNLA